MLKQLAAAAFAAVAVAAIASTVKAGGRCPPEACTYNGLSRNGLQLEGIALEQTGGLAVLAIEAIRLPSGEVVSVDTQEAPIVLTKKVQPKPRPYDELVRDNTVTTDEHATIGQMN